MPEITKVALNAGELSDEMAGRPDLSKAQMGCEIAENVRILRIGGQQRRAGFEYSTGVYDQARKSRLQGFHFGSIAGDDQGYCLEFSHLKMRVLRNGQLVEDGGGPLEYTTPWSENEIFSLQFSQRVDRIIITHKDVSVHTITREADGTWIIEDFPWQERIWEPSFVDGIALTPGAATGSTTLTASAALFSADWVGTRLRLDYTKDEEVFSGSSYVTPQAVIEGPVEIKGDWSFETTGKWSGTIEIERRYNGGSWTVIKTLTSIARSKNYILNESEEFDAGAEIQIKYNHTGTSGSPLDYIFTVSSVNTPGFGVITGFTSPTEVDFDVEREFILLDEAHIWFEEAFSPKNGYPQTSTFHQKRLFFGGSKLRPQSIWGSKTRKPFDFSQGTNDDDGVTFETEAIDYEEVYWITSHLSLLVGTSSGVWAITSPDGRSLTPESNAASRQVKHGSYEGIPAVPVDNNVLFLQRRGRKIHELTGGSVEYGGYLSVDLTQLASHITSGGVTQICSGEIPDSTLYVVSGGELAVLTYERPQNVVGWARWVTDGTIESVATCPGAGEDDDVYIVVDRDGNRTIEFLSPDMLRVEEANDVENLVHLDSCVKKSSGVAFSTVDGLDHLEGKEVCIFLDGEPQGEAIVSAGEITLSREGFKAVVGLPYTSITRPMPIDLGGIGSKSSFHEAIVRFRNTLGGQVSQDGESWSDIDFTQPRITEDKPLSLVSEDVKMTPHGTHKRQTSISIRQTQPLPMTILAIRVKGKTSR